MLSKDEIKDNLKFYKWSKIDTSIKWERPVEYDMDDFFDEIRKDPPYTDKPCYVINNTVNGKTADDFLCPSMNFFDIDFHFDNEEDKLKELELFYSDTNTKSLQEFVDKLKNDTHIISGGLSKSLFGIRGFVNIQSSFFEEYIKYGIDYPTNILKQIHKSNYQFLMKYLSDNYGIKLNRKYAGDVSAGKLSQVTFRYCITGSFYKDEWEPLYNENIIIKEENYEIVNGNEKIQIPYLDNLYEFNKDKFKEIFEHYDKFNGLFYCLRNQPEDIIHWFYNMINENYSKNGGFRKYLIDFKTFKEHVLSKKDGNDLLLSVFFFNKGIIPPIKFEEIETVEDEVDEEIERNDLRNTPIIPTKVYDDLPEFLKNLTYIFDSSRDKDLILLSLLTILGPCFKTVSTTYFRKKQFLNFYTFIGARSGLGKGIMSSSKKILNKTEDTFYENYIKSYDEYILLDDKEKKHIEPPILKSLLIAGDSSKASVNEDLINNEGVGIVFENEADILTSNNEGGKQGGWGDFSVVLRNAFQNEDINIGRVSKKRRIKSPNISVCISGTIDQPKNMIGKKGAENGLLSRFIYYLFDMESKWISPFKDYDLKGMKNFELASLQLKNMIDDYISDYWNVKLTDKQISEFDSIFSREMNDIVDYNSNSYDAIVKRHGLVAVRIMGILSCLRRYENNIFNIKKRENINIMEDNIIFVDDIDFYNSIEIVKILIKHSELLFNNIAGTDDVVMNYNNLKTDFLDLLPKEFNLKSIDSVNKNQKYNYSKSTLTRMISKWKNFNLISKKNHHLYSKIS